MKKILFLILISLGSLTFAQNISFTFVNPRNTTDGADTYYEADIYISSDSDFKVGSGQIYFNYNTEAFGENVWTNGNFSMEVPDECLLGPTLFNNSISAYTSFIVNDNTASRVSTSFQQAMSAGTIGEDNITSTPTHIYSVKFKYVDTTKEPMVAFEDDEDAVDMARDQFFTACGPFTTPILFDLPDCTTLENRAVQIQDANFDSSGAALSTPLVWTGASGTQWNSSSNWDTNTIPTADDDIEIPSTVSQPEISGASFEVNDVTMDSNTSLSITNGGSLIVNNFDSNGSITLNSSITMSSALIASSASGTVTYQISGYLTNEWSVVSAPVAGQSIKAFIENTDNNIRVNNTVTPNRYAVAHYENEEWVYYNDDDLAADTLTFEMGKSYAISKGSDGSLTFTGTIETNDISTAVVPEQWNALGNPYTALLPVNGNSDENFINSNIANLDSSFSGIFTWDASQNKYVGYSLASDDFSLSAGEGFFVLPASNTTNIDFNENLRDVVDISIYQKNDSNDITIDLIASNSNLSVKTDINFTDATSKGLDQGYDLGNFGDAEFDIYTKIADSSTDVDYTIQSLGTNDIDDLTLSVGMKANIGTEITISANTENIPSGIHLYLLDEYSGIYTNLLENDYTFTTEEDMHGVGRLYLQTSAKSLSTNDVDKNLNISIYKSNSQEVTVNGLTDEATLSVYTLEGKIAYTTTISDTINIVKLPDLSASVYIIQISQNGKIYNQKIIID